MSKRGRRGQITIYIIAGILLLALVISVYMLSRTTYEERSGVGTRVLTSIPSELEPMRGYVEQCLYDVTLDALRKAGAQGGYINPRQQGMDTSYVDATEGDAVLFSTNADFMIPYWYYLESSNNCRDDCMFLTQRPPLLGASEISVESQVEAYIVEELPRCLKGLVPLIERGFALEVQGEMRPDVTFNERDVTVFLEYPVLASTEGTNMVVSDYETTLDVPFRQLHNYATLISAAAEEYHFLERHALELISVYSGTSKEQLPPFSASTFEFASSVFWIRSQVQERIEQTLMSYVPGLKVRNAKNYVPYEYESDSRVAPAIQRLYDNMVLPMEDEGYGNLAVDFLYLGWPIYFDINAKGELIRPDSVSIDFFPWFGIQQFNNLYDVSFPVVISIHDDEVLNGDGFTFNFALESNIRNNDPMTFDFNQSDYESPYIEESKIFCDPQQLNSGNITLRVVDGLFDEPVKDAQILYTCGDWSCALAVTPEDGIVKQRFPICSGGVVSVLKQDYVNSNVVLNTQLDQSEDLGDIAFEPLRTRELRVMKKPLVKTGSSWVFAPEQARDLAPKEYAILSFKQVLDGGKYGYQTVAQVSSGGPDDVFNVSLVPGVYEVRIDIFSNQKLVIEPDKRESGGEEYYVPEEAMELDSYVAGGLVAGDSTGFLRITDALDDAQTIVFSAVGFDLAGVSNLKIEDLEQMSKIEEYSRKFYDHLQPRYE